jgi:hypothetical protein
MPVLESEQTSHRAANVTEKCKSLATLWNHALDLVTCNYCVLIKTSENQLLIVLKKVCNVMCDIFLYHLPFISSFISLYFQGLLAAFSFPTARHFLQDVRQPEYFPRCSGRMKQNVWKYFAFPLSVQ